MHQARCTAARAAAACRPCVAPLLLALALLAWQVGAAASAEGAPPAPKLSFREATGVAGVHHAYTGDWEFFPGGGVSAFDCDADGRSELFFAGGATPAALYHNDSVPGGALRFAPLARPALELRDVTGAYPLDVDGDGHVDLAVLRVGENVLLRGTGDCNFDRANELWGFDGGDAWTVAFAAVWEAGAKLPTLLVGNYIDRDAPGSPWGTCAANELHRPHGGRYGAVVPLEPGYCSLSMLVSDWDRDRVPDVWVTNDRQYYLAGSDRSGEDQLWRLEPGAAPYRYTAADGWPRLQIFGMGIASADLTGDGRPEFFLTSMADNKLRLLPPGVTAPRFEDGAYARGITAHRPATGGDTRPSTGWHAQFEDVDQDGLLDLFIAKGNVEAMPAFAAKDPNDLLLGRADGSFEPAAARAGVLSFERARGAQLVDLNGDGLLDLVVANRGAEAQLWRNVSTGLGHALLLRLHQAGANPAGIGAWLEVDLGASVVRRELHVGGGHASGQWGWTHVGVGAARQVAVTVEWPDGVRQTWPAVPVDHAVDLVRGSPVVVAAPLARSIATEAQR